MKQISLTGVFLFKDDGFTEDELREMVISFKDRISSSVTPIGFLRSHDDKESVDYNRMALEVINIEYDGLKKGIKATLRLLDSPHGVYLQSALRKGRKSIAVHPVLDEHKRLVRFDISTVNTSKILNNEIE